MSVTSTASSVRPHPQDQDELAVHDRRVSVDGMHTQYLEAGVGPVLLLLHGHEQSATSWRWVIPALARTHRVLALSLPGHGETAAAVRRLRPRLRPGPFRGRVPRHPPHRPATGPGRTLRRRGARATAGAGRPPAHPIVDPGRQRRTRTRGAPAARPGHPADHRRTGHHDQPPARRRLGPHHHVNRHAVRPALAGPGRIHHRTACPRTPPRPARSLHRHSPRPVRPDRTTPGPARTPPHPDHPHPASSGAAATTSCPPTTPRPR